MKEQYVLREIEYTSVYDLNRLPENFYEEHEQTIKRLLELKLIQLCDNQHCIYKLTGAGHLASNIGFFNWYNQIGYLEDELIKVKNHQPPKKKSWWDKVARLF